MYMKKIESIITENGKKYEVKNPGEYIKPVWETGCKNGVPYEYVSFYNVKIVNGKKTEQFTIPGKDVASVSFKD